MGLEEELLRDESILYHLHSPCRVQEVASFEPIVREWVPDGHAHRHLRTYEVEPGGDAIGGRRLLMWNDDVEIELCRPTEPMDFFYRNGEGDEVVFAAGSGTLETIFGDRPYKEGDYVVIPRGTTYRFVPEGEQRHVVFNSPGLIEIPRRYRNEYGQLLEHAPTTTATCTRRSSSGRTHRSRRARRQAADQGRLPDLRARLPPLRRRRLGRLRLPVDVQHPRASSRSRADPCRRRRTRPSRAGTSSSARSARASSTSTPRRSTIPYHHSNLNSEEMIYYVDGNFSSRKGIEIGSVTLHPSGIPHGPHPGRREVDRADEA